MFGFSFGCSVGVALIPLLYDLKRQSTRVTTHQYWHLITEKTSENGVSESYNLHHHLHSFPERELYLGCLLFNKQKAKAETSSRCKSLWKQRLFTVLWYQNQRLQQINWLMTFEQNKSSTSEDTFLQWNYRWLILSESKIAPVP